MLRSRFGGVLLSLTEFHGVLKMKLALNDVTRVPQMSLFLSDNVDSGLSSKFHSILSAVW